MASCDLVISGARVIHGSVANLAISTGLSSVTGLPALAIVDVSRQIPSSSMLTELLIVSLSSYLHRPATASSAFGLTANPHGGTRRQQESGTAVS